MFKCLFLYTFLIFLSVSWTHPNFDKISTADKEKLESFFNFLIHNSTIGYSLCGEKPVSIETFPALSRIPSYYAIQIFVKHPGYSILWNGIESWQRYSHLFPSNHFVFRFISAYNTIVLINKRATLRVIEENLDLFQKFSNSSQTAIEFLEEVCYPKDKEYMIRHNMVLLGILLGFGRNNSLAFYERHIQKLEGFKLYNTDDSLNAFMNPGFFIVNNNANKMENKKIRRILRLAKRNIESNFQNGNYFENFVYLFTQK